MKLGAESLDRVTSEFLSEDAGEVDSGAGQVAWRAVGSMKPAVPRRGQRIPKGGTWFGRQRAGFFDKADDFAANELA